MCQSSWVKGWRGGVSEDLKEEGTAQTMTYSGSVTKKPTTIGNYLNFKGIDKINIFFLSFSLCENQNGIF